MIIHKGDILIHELGVYSGACKVLGVSAGIGFTNLYCIHLSSGVQFTYTKLPRDNLRYATPREIAAAIASRVSCGK